MNACSEYVAILMWSTSCRIRQEPKLASAFELDPPRTLSSIPTYTLCTQETQKVSIQIWRGYRSECFSLFRALALFGAPCALKFQPASLSFHSSTQRSTEYRGLISLIYRQIKSPANRLLRSIGLHSPVYAQKRARHLGKRRPELQKTKFRHVHTHQFHTMYV